MMIETVFIDPQTSDKRYLVRDYEVMLRYIKTNTFITENPSQLKNSMISNFFISESGNIVYLKAPTLNMMTKPYNETIVTQLDEKLYQLLFNLTCNSGKPIEVCGKEVYSKIIINRNSIMTEDGLLLVTIDGKGLLTNDIKLRDVANTELYYSKSYTEDSSYDDNMSLALSPFLISYSAAQAVLMYHSYNNKDDIVLTHELRYTYSMLKDTDNLPLIEGVTLEKVTRAILMFLLILREANIRNYKKNWEVLI